MTETEFVPIYYAFYLGLEFGLEFVDQGLENDLRFRGQILRMDYCDHVTNR